MKNMKIIFTYPLRMLRIFNVFSGYIEKTIIFLFNIFLCYISPFNIIINVFILYFFAIPIETFIYNKFILKKLDKIEDDCKNYGWRIINNNPIEMPFSPISTDKNDRKIIIRKNAFYAFIKIPHFKIIFDNKIFKSINDLDIFVETHQK